jgi:hypothetical protein
LSEAGRAPPRRRRAQRIVAGALAVVLVTIVVTGVLLAGGRYDTYDRTALLTRADREQAPAWTRACWSTVRVVTEATACVRVSGRVVWLERHDTDGDGDRHVILISRLHPRIVKLDHRLRVGDLPRIGSRVEAAGWMIVGASGRREVDALFYHSGHTTARLGV